MRFEKNIQLRDWRTSYHVIERFIEKNKFLDNSNWGKACREVIKMMDEAILITYDYDTMADIYSYKSWILVCQESTIVTIYPKKGSRWESFVQYK